MTEPGKQTDLRADPGGQSAEYIGDLTLQLAKLARRSRYNLLAYLLDIASLEARTLADREKTSSQSGDDRRAVHAVQG